MTNACTFIVFLVISSFCHQSSDGDDSTFCPVRRRSVGWFAALFLEQKWINSYRAHAPLTR